MSTSDLLTYEECEELTKQLMSSLLTPTEYAAALGVSYMTAMRKMQNHEVQTIQVGRDVYVWTGSVGSPRKRKPRPTKTKAVAKTKTEPTRGTRIPDDYVPAQKSIDQIREEFPGVTDEDFKREHAKFCDFWQGKSGKDATKVNWDSTWKNWMRTADERGQLRRGRPPVNRRTNADKSQEWLDMEVPNAEGE